MVAGKLDLQKRQHRERGQPLNRQKHGLLEKHADYVKRARDFHSKEDRIKKLKEKAAQRNKDEFYFGMIRSKTKGGVHIASRGNEPMPVDLVKVLKTQDSGYIRTQTALEQARAKRLQEQLDALIPPANGTDQGDNSDDDDFDFDFDDEPPKKKHIVFSSSVDALKTAVPRKRRKPNSTVQDEEAIRHRKSLQTELEARKGRLDALKRASRELEVQRAIMGKGAKKELLPDKKSKKDKADEDWDAMDSDIPSGLPEPSEGIKTGARVFKWKQKRKR